MCNKILKSNTLNLSNEEIKKLKKSANTEEELINIFQIIKNRNWIQYERIQGNSDGLLGNIFEDLIGISENNKRYADYNDFEIKTKNLNSSAFVSLFGYCIDSVHSANTKIREQYGVLDEKTNHKIFNTTIKYGFWNYHRGGYSFMLKKSETKLFLKIKNIKTNEIIDNDEYYWTISKIKTLFQKIKNSCLIFGEINKDKKMVKYEKMLLCKNAEFEMFWKMLEMGDIVVDFRIGVYKSGKNIGKTHDHGTGFRIKINKYINLYKNIIEI